MNIELRVFFLMQSNVLWKTAVEIYFSKSTVDLLHRIILTIDRGMMTTFMMNWIVLSSF